MNILDYEVFDFAGRVLDAYPEPVPFEDFGPYRIREPLGKGGMGEVFLAEDVLAGRRVAIKFLVSVWRAPDLRDRFTREVKTLAKLEHASIARLYDAGLHPSGTPYFAMEYVEGKHIDQYCRDREYSADECLTLFRSVCSAVQYAHTHLVVHRDLKPSNVLVTEDGTPKLLDFGIAKQLENLDEPVDQTQTELRFTRAFAAPEQLRREPVGVYTDVYALGVILYELLARKPPFDLDKCTPLEAELIITGNAEPPKPSASPKRVKAGKAAWSDLDILCLKAIKKDVARRYHSVVELTQDVDRYVKRKPLLARPDTLQYRLGKFVKRNQRAVLATALTLATVIGMVVFFTARLAKERDRALRETAIATSMNRFLSDDLLGRSDPFKSGKAQESFADVVNRASPRIDAQFPTEPLVAARLHATVAKAFDHRSDFGRARPEYERAINLFQRAEGPLSQDAIALRLQRAVMETISSQPGSLPVAQSLVRDAKSAMFRITRPRNDLTIWLPYAQGAIAIVQNDAHAANDNFSLALQRAKATPSLDGLSQIAMTQMVAFSYVRLDEGAKAEPLLREVIRAYLKVYGPDSAEVLRAQGYLAMALMREHKYADVIKQADLIYPTLRARLGDDHQVTLALLGTRAASEGYLGLFDRAAHDDLALHDAAVRKQGPASMLSLVSLSDAALSQCRAGRYAEGELNARNAFQASAQAFGPRAGLTGGSSYSLAVCLIGADKLAEASELLSNIDADAVAQLSGDSTVPASIALARAQIAVKQRDYRSAQHLLQIAAPALEGPQSDPFDRRTLEDLKRTIDRNTIPMR